MAALKKIYDSKYTDKKLTASQYLAEMMCERLAKKNGVSLIKYFWHEKEWEKFYMYQIRLATGLLRSYSIEALIQAVGKLHWAWSLATGKLQEEINQIYMARNKDMFETQDIELPVEKRNETKKKNLFEKLG